MPVNVRRQRVVWLVIAMLHCANGWSAGVLKLSRTELVLEPGKPTPELWVENTGDTPLFLSMEQQLVTNPGATPEQRVPIGETRHPALLVRPGRLVLAPGQKYRMNLTVLDVPARPQVWRLTFRPRERVEVHGDDGRPITSPLFINVGYGVVVYQMPGGAGKAAD
ncbi:hypothetical protein [Burkholderia plantarii]|uniref:hypothetical protein n=1 Tax=Burkholderia plantarii TaxID=41899 RepID=UPI001F5B0817|nr:hypothetical protein [Burkholderia plantarii]